ncbi:phenol hydroxylase subunit [Oceanisphaera sp.]|uniref:phenol hydroxylase subunit n=1 Tax=Oceanisphaera sp. TaxID=1929979 RepID=UPI003A917007
MDAPRPRPVSPTQAPTTSLTKYIRVRSPQDARFVEFDFAINDPGLFVELVMPKDAFKRFCQANQVVEMTRAQSDAVDAEMDKWRYGEETLLSRNQAHSHK